MPKPTLITVEDIHVRSLLDSMHALALVACVRQD